MLAQVKRKLLERVKPIHRKYRAQKIELFLRIAGNLDSPARLLDVGGGPGVDGEFLDLYCHFGDVVVANLDPTAFEAPPGIHVETLIADGRCLPFTAASFEWVFSNAVIEHVGGWDDQVRFAQEIRRVASVGYFITTPNRYFPLEPHTFLPFYQFLPISLQRRLAPYSPAYVSHYVPINLLSATQMQELFPEAEVVPIGFPVLGNSLVAYYRKDKLDEMADRADVDSLRRWGKK